MHASRCEHGRGRYGVGALIRLGLFGVGHVGRVGAGHIVEVSWAAHREVLRGPQHRTAVPAAAVLGGAAGGAVGQLLAVLLWDYHAAVVADIGVTVEGGARSRRAKAAVGRRVAGEVGIVGGRARTGGGRLEWRGEVWDLGAQLRLVIQAVVGIRRMRVVRGRRHAWVAGRAWQGGCLGTDDRRRTVHLAEVGERDLGMER